MIIIMGTKTLPPRDQDVIKFIMPAIVLTARLCFNASSLMPVNGRRRWHRDAPPVTVRTHGRYDRIIPLQFSRISFRQHCAVVPQCAAPESHQFLLQIARLMSAGTACHKDLFHGSCLLAVAPVSRLNGETVLATCWPAQSSKRIQSAGSAQAGDFGWRVGIAAGE